MSFADKQDEIRGANFVDFTSDKTQIVNNSTSSTIPKSKVTDVSLLRYFLENSTEVKEYINNKNNQGYIPNVEFQKLYQEEAISMEGDYVNEQKYLDVYIQKLDEDRRQLQSEFKEREERITRQTENSEKRMEEKLDKIERLLLEQNNRIDGLKDEVRNQLSEDKKYRHTNNIAIVIGVVTTVLAILGIALATQSNITDIISLALPK